MSDEPEALRRESNLGWKPQPHPSTRGAVIEGAAKIVTAFSGKEHNETAFTVKYSHDGLYAAASFGNGAWKIYDTKTWQQLHRIKSLAHNSEGLAVTSVKWRPHCPTRSYDLVAGCASGVVQQWTWDQDDTKAEVEHVQTLVEDGNEVMSVDFSPDGNLIASGGSDRLVRVYDTMSSKLQHELQHGLDERGYVRQGHSARIFSVRFVNAHTIISAGWQSACQVWDLRTGRSERQLMGTHVCADAIEVNHNTSTIIVASYRNTQQIMMFDYLSGRECTPEAATRNIGSTHLYCARLGSDQTTLWCTGSKPNAIFQLDVRTGQILGSVTELPVTYFSADLNPANSRQCLLGGSKESVMLLELAK